MPSAARDALEAAHDAVTALTGWTKSRWPPGQFGKDPSRGLHLTYALGLPSTVPDPNDRRQIAAHGIVSSSVLELRWAHQIRGDAAVEDYAAALEQEQALLLAILGASKATHVVFRLTEAARDDSREGWLFGAARFDVTHRFGLTT